MPDDVVAVRELSELAVGSDPLPRRAAALLSSLRRIVPFDGAWLALADPHHPHYTSLASVDIAESTRTFFTGPEHARDIELAGTHLASPPVSPSDLPFPAEEMSSWADYLIPAGYHEGLGVALFAPGGRHVGFLALLSSSTDPPSSHARRMLARLTSVLAFGVDPMRSLEATARLVHGAAAGVLLLPDGGTEALPGLRRHAVLAADSPALIPARAAIAAGRLYSSFLWPLGGRDAPKGYVRITALSRSEDLPVHLTGMALVSPAGDLRGLTPRELEVLGLLIDGSSNSQIAQALGVALRTVAAHLEHILVKLSAPSRTLAAVRAERAGLYVPRRPGTPPQHP
jgi:DNA-binding CsgD family transcriptional regulator